MMHGQKNIQLMYSFQASHPHCVDRITSIDKCSQTQLLIFVLLRGVSTWLLLRLAMWKHLLAIQILIVMIDCILWIRLD